MNPDTFCSTDHSPWSVLTSAGTFSNLAGLLAGFTIAAIALLFDRGSRESIHTLALFSAGVLVLTLDSYLFSVVAGIHPPETGDRMAVCSIAWTQGMAALGMLAAGATALIGGLGWMLASHALNKLSGEGAPDSQAYCFLAVLGGWLTFSVAVTTTLLLMETAIDYLLFLYGRHIAWGMAAIIIAATALVVADFYFVYFRARNLRRSLTGGERSIHLALRSIKSATVSTVVLATVATVWAATLYRLPQDWFTTPHIVTVLSAIAVGFALPGLISTIICRSVPSAQPWTRP